MSKAKHRNFNLVVMCCVKCILQALNMILLVSFISSCLNYLLQSAPHRSAKTTQLLLPTLSISLEVAISQLSLSWVSSVMPLDPLSLCSVSLNKMVNDKKSSQISNRFCAPQRPSEGALACAPFGNKATLAKYFNEYNIKVMVQKEGYVILMPIIDFGKA